MRISIPIDVWDPGRGGAERYLDRLSRELKARGHEIVILCQRVLSGAGAGDSPRIEVLDVPWFPRWLRELRFARAAVRAHRSSGREILFQVRHALEADVYQPHGGSYLASRDAQGRALSTGRRLLRDAAAFLRPSHHVLRGLDHAVFDRSPHVTTLSVSAKVEEDYRRVYPARHFRFERLHNPVDSEAFHDRDRAECRARLLARFQIPSNQRIALFAAHHFRPKGLQFAIRALRQATGWDLVVLGRDEVRPFERLARRLRVERRTHFAGVVKDIRSFHAGSDAFLLPTLYDPCSLSVLEALACGTPAVTTFLNGASDSLVAGSSGFALENPADDAAIARSLKTIDDRWEEMHAGARAAALQLGWKDHVDRLEMVLCQIGRRT